MAIILLFTGCAPCLGRNAIMTMNLITGILGIIGILVMPIGYGVLMSQAKSEAGGGADALIDGVVDGVLDAAGISPGWVWFYHTICNSAWWMSLALYVCIIVGGFMIRSDEAEAYERKYGHPPAPGGPFHPPVHGGHHGHHERHHGGHRS